MHVNQNLSVLVIVWLLLEVPGQDLNPLTLGAHDQASGKRRILGTHVCTCALGQRVLLTLQNGLHISLLWSLAAMPEALGWAGVRSLMGKALWVPLHSLPLLASQTHAFSGIQDIYTTTNQALSWALRGHGDCCQYATLPAWSSQSLGIEGDRQATCVSFLLTRIEGTDGQGILICRSHSEAGP